MRTIGKSKKAVLSLDGSQLNKYHMDADYKLKWLLSARGKS